MWCSVRAMQRRCVAPRRGLGCSRSLVQRPPSCARAAAGSSPGTALLEATGPVAALHRTYKSVQVLMEWAGGIASAAAAIVAAAGGVPVACTRKNVPGTRALSAKAVRAGGARLHRLGLSETLLVFDEHRLFLDEDPTTTILRLKAAEPEKKIVVEVAEVDEALRWAQAGADVLQLEKFAPERVAACRRIVDVARPGVKLAATGCEQGVGAWKARKRGSNCTDRSG